MQRVKERQVCIWAMLKPILVQFETSSDSGILQYFFVLFYASQKGLTGSQKNWYYCIFERLVEVAEIPGSCFDLHL